MSRLIGIALRVHFKNRIFLLCCAAVTATGVICGVLHRTAPDWNRPGLYAWPFVIALAASLVTQCFGICGEFSGGIKNKLIRGYTKLQFGIAQLVPAVLCSIVFFLLGWAPYFLIAYDRFFSQYTGQILFRGFMLLFSSVLMLCVLYVTVCLTVRRTAAAVLVCFFLTLGLELFSDDMRTALMQPMYSLENGIVEYEYEPEYREIVIREPDEVPFEWYVDGTKRDIIRLAYIFNPMTSFLSGWRSLLDSLSCYSLESVKDYIEFKREDREQYIYNMEFIEEDYLYSIYYPLRSGGLVLLITAAGLAVFRKRNIK